MDIRAYFQKLQDVERGLTAKYMVVVSQETGNGGQAGVKTEVNRSVAAKLIVSGKARLATDAEAEEFRAEQERARAAAEQAQLAGRVQLAVLSDQELSSLRSSLRPQKR